jgi:dihydropyrimidinase
MDYILKKGALMPGSDGYIVIFDPSKITKVIDKNSVYINK